MYVMGQVAFTAPTTAVTLFNIPSGLCNFSFFVTSGTAWAGTSTAVTTTNGMQIPTNPGIPFQNYVSSKGATFYGVGTASVSFFMSTDQ